MKFQRLSFAVPDALDVTEQKSIQNNIYWPTTKKFTVEVGKQKIKEYISSWKLNYEWKYVISKDSEWENECSRYFGYTVSSKRIVEYLPVMLFILFP